MKKIKSTSSDDELILMFLNVISKKQRSVSSNSQEKAAAGKILKPYHVIKLSFLYSVPFYVLSYSALVAKCSSLIGQIYLFVSKKWEKLMFEKNKMLQIHPVKLAVGVNGCIMNRVQKYF